MKIKWMILCVVLCIVNASVAATVKLPDGQIALSFTLRDVAGVKDCPTYSVSFKGKLIIDESRLGFDLNNGSELSNSFEVLSTDTRTHVRIERFIVTSQTALMVSMTNKGGQAIRIVPATPLDSYPLYSN